MAEEEHLPGCSALFSTIDGGPFNDRMCDCWPERIADLRAQLAAKDAEVARLTAENARLREEIGDLSGHIADFRAQIEAAEKSAMLAYGWLWHAMTSDKRVRIPRAVLRDVLSTEQRQAGIQAAKDVGARIEESDFLGVDAAIDAALKGEG